jgi:phosphatidylserine decarboxylase
MTSLHASNINKPIDPQTRDILCHPDTGEVHTPEHVADALYAAVDASATNADVQAGIHAPMHKVPTHGLFSKFVPGLEHLATTFHVGNFVVVRGTDEKFFESMPIYTRSVHSVSRGLAI